MHKSGAGTDGPVPTASAPFGRSFAADPIQRPIGPVVSRKAKTQGGEVLLWTAWLGAFRS